MSEDTQAAIDVQRTTNDALLHLERLRRQVTTLGEAAFMAHARPQDARIAALESQLAEAKALLREVSYEGYRVTKDDLPRDELGSVPLRWFHRRDALLNHTPEPKETNSDD